jgi:hypothetical protein
MATYVVHYDMVKVSPGGSKSTSPGTKTVTAETESTAIQIAKDQSERTDYTFKLKRVEKKK